MVEISKSAGIASASATGPFALHGPGTNLPLRDGSITLAALIDLYMAQYTGRDSARGQRLSWWALQVGDIALQDLADDQIHVALERLAAQESRYFAGIDVAGRPIYRSKRKPIAPATVNRYLATLAAVITWAMKRRIAPRDYAHPCRSIERRPENNERTRYLTEDERDRLLRACEASRWPRPHSHGPNHRRQKG